MSVSLIMPMAGRGSRFSAAGVSVPKPLVDLAGRPFFWWAVESVQRATLVDEIIFVILEEHQIQHQLGDIIRSFYPQAKIRAISDVTSGSAETALLGAEWTRPNHPIAVNDCDHAFIAGDLDTCVANLAHESAALLTFRSDRPSYSFAKLDPAGQVIGTVEKEVASNFAIAGCYLFASTSLFAEVYEAYKRDCPYSELFISGMYNLILEQGGKVGLHVLEEHFPFGTPGELEFIRDSVISKLSGWKA